MFCRICGNSLPENEQVCPNCGTMKVQNQQIQTPQVMNQQMPFQISDGMQPNIPMKKNNTTQILAAVLLIVIVLCLFLYLFVFNKNSILNRNIGSGSVSYPNEISYGGFTFVIPDGYKAQVLKGDDDGDALVIKNSSFTYIVAVDLNNNYERYKNELLNRGRDANVTMIDGREYVKELQKSETLSNIALYTKATSTSTFLIYVMPAAAFSTEQEKIVSSIVGLAKEDNSYVDSNNVDAGKNGIISDFSRYSSILE